MSFHIQVLIHHGAFWNATFATRLVFCDILAGFKIQYTAINKYPIAGKERIIVYSR